MSIVTPNRRPRTRWFWPLEWLGRLTFALLIASLAAISPLAVADDLIPAEPDDIVIVSDDEDSPAPTPAKKSRDEQPAEESAPEKMPPPDKSDDGGDEENKMSETVEAAEEGPADEVAPIDPVAPEVPPPVEETTESESSEAPATAEGPRELPAEETRAAVEGASFKGVLPSVTTADELEKSWGSAKEVRKAANGKEHVYYQKPFKQVVVTIIDEKVDTLRIQLDELVEPKVLAKQLLLADVEPATIYNAKGQMLGMAFPERGVLFAFASGSPVRVGQIVLEPINSQPFLTRAEKNCSQRPLDALVDVDYAIEIDPDYERAHALRARVMIELCRLDDAKKSIDKALSLMPHDAEYRLIAAKIAYARQDFENALELVRRLTDDDQASQLVKAQAELIWGDVLAEGPSRAFDEAIKHHTAAIKLAEQVSAKSSGPVRRTAKETLVDCHLAVAHDIAWGNWQQKSKVVPQWLDRADAFCTNLIKKDHGDEQTRLRVYEQSLHCYAGMKDCPAISEKLDALSKLARKTIADETVAARRERVQWNLGLALSSAMSCAQERGENDAATQYGQQALACFEQSGKIGKAHADYELAMGKVYYRLGAILAIDGQDHEKAIALYNQAAPLLESPAAPSADSGRMGEMFVSMAVSYWETGKRDEAVRLTQQGAKMMESAVADKRFPKAALAVPYANLASMHHELGHETQSKEFAEMAARSDKKESLRR